MAELTLISKHKRSLKPLVQAALENEIRLLAAGVNKSERRLGEFEEHYHLSTEEFLRKYENDELDETLELDEWVGEYRLAERLREKVDTLKGVKFAD
jgi:hypothetical protein